MPCPICNSSGLCAADCSLAPWNQDRPLPDRRLRIIGYLLRQRRWLGEHVNDYARWIRWVSVDLARQWGPSEWHFAGRLREIAP